MSFAENLENYLQAYDRDPEIIRRILFPKNILCPPGFFSFKREAVLHIPKRVEVQSKDDRLAADCALSGALTAFHSVSVAIPEYWCSRGIISLAMATEPPGELPIASLNWPHVMMLYHFPIGALPVHGMGSIIACLITYSDSEVVTGGISCRLWDNCGYYVAINYAADGTVSDIMRPSRVDGDEDISMSPEKLSEALVVIVNLAAIMVDRSELIIEPNVTVKARNGKNVSKRRPALYSPRWLTAPPAIKEAIDAEMAHRASGKSPRCHWRRGHWRQQWYGSGEHRETRLKWIEPMLVALKPRLNKI